MHASRYQWKWMIRSWRVEREVGRARPNISKHVSTAHWTAQPCPQNQTSRSTRANLFCLCTQQQPVVIYQRTVFPSCRYPFQRITPVFSSDTQSLDFKPLLHSTMAVSVLSNFGFTRSSNVFLLMLTGLSMSSPIRSPENSQGIRMGDNPLLDAQVFLSQFLSTMNLTELRSQPRPLPARREPPEYMLELYDRFVNDVG